MVASWELTYRQSSLVSLSLLFIHVSSLYNLLILITLPSSLHWLILLNISDIKLFEYLLGRHPGYIRDHPNKLKGSILFWVNKGAIVFTLR